MPAPDQALIYGNYVQPGGPLLAQPFNATRDAALLVAPSATRYEYPSSLGLGWATMATSAVAALVVRPTTTAAFELFNNNVAGGPSFIIDRLFSQWLVSTAAAASAAIWAMVTAPKSAPSSASLAVTGNYGKSYGGNAVNAVGTTVVANGWYPYGPSVSGSGTATPSGSWEAQIEGRLIVPPQCSLCVHVVASLVGDTFCSGASWFEKILILP